MCSSFGDERGSALFRPAKPMPWCSSGLSGQLSARTSQASPWPTLAYCSFCPHGPIWQRRTARWRMDSGSAPAETAASDFAHRLVGGLPTWSCPVEALRLGMGRLNRQSHRVRARPAAVHFDGTNGSLPPLTEAIAESGGHFRSDDCGSPNSPAAL